MFKRQNNFKKYANEKSFDPNINYSVWNPKNKLNPNIESYIKTEDINKSEIENNYKTHTCTVMFKAPNEVDEGDIMKYILEIVKEIDDVKVLSFKWSESETKKK